ncbi:ABC transporter permease [Paenibacillus sp. S150]|uniref:ABC transporter permease n=1 Tax=Paenibacillus sp. S150 TaxID=2749826 RepID=UPI001C593498|nr:ABC transporter permease [Paenibacillus sp. S150]MBW4081161.1 ABC transporter permease [Paenibacillus sp. S150]
MYNLISADVFKMRKSAAIKIIFAITAICAAAMSVMAYLIPQGKVDASLSGIGFMFSDMNVISILGAVLAGIYICGDYENKTIHNAISSGVGRGTVIAGKTIVFCGALAVILLPYAIATAIALGTGSEFSTGSVSLGFLNVLTSGAGRGFSASDSMELLVISAVLIIVYMAQLSVTIPLAILLKRPVLVIAIYYGLSVLSGQLAGIAGRSPGFERIFALTPFSGNYTLITLDTGAGEIIQALLVSVLFALVMLAVTYSVFRRSEIK